MVGRSRYSPLCFFAVGLLLQGHLTWQLEESLDGLTRTQRGERDSPGFCPDGWYTFGEMCYMPGMSKLTWERADRECSRSNSVLVSINSKDEQDFLNLLVLEIRYEVWIGLRRSTARDEFKWRDSLPLNYTHWAEGEPNNYGSWNENCVEMHYDRFNAGEWNDATCSRNRYYICKKPKDPNLTTPGKDPAMCEGKKGWLKMRSSCYRIFSRTESFSSWSRAQSLCKSYGGNLGYVKNPAINKLLQMNSKGLKGPFWTGLKSTKKHRYSWLGKKYPLMYSNWQTAEPKEIPDKQNCVAMDTEGKWIIRDCAESHAFICEIGPAVPEAPTLQPFGTNMTCSYTSQKWHDIGGQYCYIIELHAKFKWREALCRCKEEGGSLASFHSSEEVNTIVHHINHQDMPPQPVFIGLVRDERGTFGWSDGSALDYTNWDTWKPNESTNQCAEMKTSGKWQDEHCNFMYGYVCSTPKVPQRQNSVSKTANLVSKSDMAEVADDIGQHLSAGSIVVIAIASVLVVAAVSAISVYGIRSSLKKCFEGSPYSGLE